MKIILTGATGMVGEGVLMECLKNNAIGEILSVSRKSSDIQDPKLKELLVPDFLNLDQYHQELSGFDACFFCAGISSVGMNEETYTKITYDTTLYFANTLAALNPNLTFHYISGQSTDSSEKGKLMWARVKGKTENDLQKIAYKAAYNYRPGGMLPVKGQKRTKLLYLWIVRILQVFIPSKILNIGDLGKAMINVTSKGYSKPVLEVKDIQLAAK